MKRVLPILLLLACGGGPFVIDEPDAGHSSDAGLSGEDAGVDAGTVTEDAGTQVEDAGFDAGITPVDAGITPVDAGTTPVDAGTTPIDAGTTPIDAGTTPIDAGTPAPCITRITYGASWFPPANHPNDYDDVTGVVTWDGSCTQDSSGNSKATLSNGWQPIFGGRSGCVIALDQRGACPTPAPACSTRISYGDTWLAAPNHPNSYDDVGGRVTFDGLCRANGSASVAQLSNGWAPNFTGSNACEIAMRYTQCGGLYTNPVVATDCPDPGVMKDGDTYYMACTSDGAANAYPLRRSTDLVNWTRIGNVMPQANKPIWAGGDFWAPELHKVGSTYIAYFSARHTNGVFALGAATSSVPQGPYQARNTPLLQTGSPGVIDVHFYEAPNGTRYLLWKPDSNAIGQQTSIRIQTLAADGLSLTGTQTTLLVNDRAWEGNVIEGPWMIHQGGYFYLFYSANGYASTAYAVGVARATSPTGPFTKRATPILVTRGAWAGPGHGSIVKGPSGDWVHVYHSWEAGNVGQSPGRQVLVDRITFESDWPVMHAGPSSGTQPLP
ncbi:MAG: glycoside hydrolase family 43 protein [Archangium sp.]|nr:glycoside hydrolase family 43 protein [Archangium sp.]MDP3570820.1 glycoside hydrolase family 43 protein [Archangium sp.]